MSSNQWKPRPDHPYCRLCTIRLDHPEIAVAGDDPTICADCETRHAARPVADPLVTVREAAQIIGVSHKYFYNRYRARLAVAGKKQARNGTVYQFRLSDVKRVAAQYATGD